MIQALTAAVLRGLIYAISLLGLFYIMIEEAANRRIAAIAIKTDPYEERRMKLHRLPAHARIIAIEADLKKVAKLATDNATFHRKKLLRMHDAARLEAGLVTAAQLQQENSFTNLDFTQARLVFRPRSRVHA